MNKIMPLILFLLLTTVLKAEEEPSVYVVRANIPSVGCVADIMSMSQKNISTGYGLSQSVCMVVDSHDRGVVGVSANREGRAEAGLQGYNHFVAGAMPAGSRVVNVPAIEQIVRCASSGTGANADSRVQYFCAEYAGGFAAEIISDIFAPASVAPDVAVARANMFAGVMQPQYIKAVRIPAVTQGLRVLASSVAQEIGDEYLATRAAELVAEVAPEMVQTYSIKLSTEEKVETEALSFYYSMNDSWSMAVAGVYENYHQNPVDAPDLSAHVSELELRLVRRLSSSARVWGGLVPYLTDTDEGVGFMAGGEWADDEGMFGSVRVAVNRPWRDNTNSVAYGGLRNDVAMALRVPVFSRFSVSGEGACGWYYGADQKGGDARFAGREYVGSLRLEYSVMQRGGAVLDRGFLNPSAEYENPLGGGLLLSGTFTARRFDLAESFVAIPVTEESREAILGAEFSHAVSNRMGFRLYAFVGQDHERNIAWSRLYGWSARVVVLPADQMRLWAEMQSSSESTSGLNDGRTDTFSIGMNVNF